MKVGIIGGTFDPIHLAHLIIAEEARSKLELDKVIFIPAGEPWMKSGKNITRVKNRVEMVNLAIESNPWFEISTIETEQPGPAYTVDTLEQLWKELGYETQMFLLMGWDSLMDMPRWKAPYRISKMAKLVAFPRQGTKRPDIADLEKSMPEITERLTILEEPYMGISSTDIRTRVAEGKSIRYLIPDAVAAYINENKLYKKT